MTSSNDKPEKGGAGQPDNEPRESEEANAKVARKIYDRRFRWRWNKPLALISAASFAVIAVLCALSYVYHSSTAATTFMARADAALEAEDYAAHTRWLKRYSMLRPKEPDVLIRIALAADKAADKAAPEQRSDMIYEARKQIGRAIGQLGEGHEEAVIDLRTRLIKRLIQLGPAWAGEVERNVINLARKPKDAEATQWIATALLSQVENGIYDDRTRLKSDDDYWEWLTSITVGEVLMLDLDANPQDLDTIRQALLAHAIYPEHFECPKGVVEEKFLSKNQERIDRAVTTLRDADDSKAYFILYRYYEASRQEADARLVLMHAADESFRKLADVDPQAYAADPSDPTEVSPYSWDFLLIYQAGLYAMEKGDMELASKYLDSLMPLDVAGVNPATRAQVFVRAGQLRELSEDPEGAIEIWQQGLEQVDSKDLLLLAVLANAKIQADPEGADQALKDLDEAIELARRALNLMSEIDVSAARRSEINEQIDAAQWRHDRLSALHMAETGNAHEAARILEEVFERPADIETVERVSVARALNVLHGQQGAWDRAAAVLSRAIAYDPDNMELRALAAQAATSAGNRLLAVENWRAVVKSDSLPLRVRSVQALFDYELRLDPDLRDFSSVRSELQALKNLLAQYALPDETEEKVALQQAIARIDVLDIMLPPEGTSVEDHLESKEVAQQAKELADRYQDFVTVQRFALLRLVATGDQEGASELTERLKNLLGEGSQEFVGTLAEVDATRGEPVKGADRLLEFAKGMEENSSRVIQRAAGLYQKAGRPDLAYGALLLIPADSLPLELMYTLATLAETLPPDSPRLVIEGTPTDQQGLVSYWTKRIRDAEGDQGTYSKFLSVTQLIREMANEPRVIEKNDERLQKCKQEIRRLLTQRPNWGEAISLEGWIAGIERDYRTGVEHLRRGIAAGDRRLNTRYELVRQLYELGRFDEADEAIRLLAFTRDSPIDDFAQVRVEMMQKKGDFDASISVARNAADNAPNDPFPQILLGNTYLIAARSEKGAEREQLIEKAKVVAKRADELAETGRPDLFLLLSAIAIETGDKDQAQEVLNQVASSNLPGDVRNTLQAHTLNQLGRYAEALELMEKADKIRPTFQTKIALAEHYRRLGRSEEEIRALQAAQQLSPRNSVVVNRLALALLARDGDDANWEQLRDVLTTGEWVTAENRLLFALMLSQQVDREKQNQAIRILREIFREDNSRSDSAARSLALLLIKHRGESSDDQLKKRLDGEVRSLYEHLCLGAEPVPVDLYRFADYLLKSSITKGDEKDLPRAKELRQRLKRIDQRDAQIFALELAMRFALHDGITQSANSIVDLWFADVTSKEIVTEVEACLIAGTALFKSSLRDEALGWFKRAYDNDPDALDQYGSALIRAGRVKDAVHVSSEHYVSHGNVEAAALLVEALLNDLQELSDSRNQKVIKQAFAEYPDNPDLLDGLATLELMQRDYPTAISLYRKALMRDPTRLRALNNLAIALAEMSREDEALTAINRAIAIAKRNGELLDTRGYVLMKKADHSGAEEAFAKAIELEDKPNFRFHLVLALTSQSKDSEAKRQWESLDHESLDHSLLTTGEQAQYDELKSKYGIK